MNEQMTTLSLSGHRHRFYRQRYNAGALDEKSACGDSLRCGYLNAAALLGLATRQVGKLILFKGMW